MAESRDRDAVGAPPDALSPRAPSAADASSSGAGPKAPSAGSLASHERSEPYDVVLAMGRTDDGAGAHVLRARPGRIEAGEVRAMTEGRPLARGGEVVRLERRKDVPALYDVHVECKVPDTAETPTRKEGGGPAQVATQAYRESWARTFGRTKREPAN